MKKTILTLALALAGAGSARAAQQPASALNGPNANSVQFSGSLDYFGGSQYYMESSTPTATAVLLASGSGFFYGVDNSSGTSGDYCIVFDLGSASGVTVQTQGSALTPAVLTSANGATTCTAQGVCGKYAPPQPRRFSHGLVAIKGGASGAGSGNNNCIVEALTDSAISSPSSH